MSKIADYLNHGSAEVWVIYPQEHELHQYQKDTTRPMIFREEEWFASELFPDLRFQIRDLFA